MVDVSELGAIDQDVPFDWDRADALITAFRTMADEIESQRGLRDTAVEGALAHWTGQARNTFVERYVVGYEDGVLLEVALRDAADQLEWMKSLAEAEQERRVAARQWVRAYEEYENNKSWWDHVTDWWGGSGFDPPPMPPPPILPPDVAPSCVTVDTRR